MAIKPAAIASKRSYLFFEAVDCTEPIVLLADDWKIYDTGLCYIYVSKELKAIINMNLMYSMEIMSPEEVEDAE